MADLGGGGGGWRPPFSLTISFHYWVTHPPQSTCLTWMDAPPPRSPHSGSATAPKLTSVGGGGDLKKYRRTIDGIGPYRPYHLCRPYRDAGAGGGGHCPPTFCLNGMDRSMPVPPPQILAITRHINIFAPPKKKKSFPRP